MAQAASEVKCADKDGNPEPCPQNEEKAVEPVQQEEAVDQKT